MTESPRDPFDAAMARLTRHRSRCGRCSRAESVQTLCFGGQQMHATAQGERARLFTVLHPGVGPATRDFPSLFDLSTPDKRRAARR